MPVQYQPVATVKPEEARRTAAIPEMHLEVPHIQFTKAIAEAIGARGEATIQYGHSMATVAASMATLGKSISGAGDEMWTRAVGLAQLDNEKKANDAIIGYEQGQTERNEKFKSLQGEAAGPGALKAFLTESENARQAIKNTLSPEGQKMYDQHTTYAYIRDSRMAASHASEQTKAATAGSYEARAKMTMSGMANSTEDKDFERGKADLAGVSYNMQALHGWTEEKRAQWYEQNLGHAIASRATNLALSNPNAAMQMLEENKKNIDPDKYVQAYHSVYNELVRSGSRNIGDKVQQDMPNAPSADRDKYAAELAERDRPGDARYRETAISEQRQRQAIQRQEDHDHEVRDHKTLIDSAYGKPGDRPEDWEHFLVKPGVREALSARPELEPHLRDIVKNNIDIDRPVDANHEEIFHDFRAKLMYDDKENTLVAMAADPGMVGRLHITAGERDRLIDIYQHERDRRGRSDESLRVEAAFRALRSTGDIPKNMTTPETRIYKSILGGLIEDELQTTHKKSLTEKDWKRLGDNAMSQVKSPTWYSSTRTKEFWRTVGKPTDSFARSYRDDHPAAGDQEIQRSWIRERVNKLLHDEEKKPVKQLPIPGM